MACHKLSRVRGPTAPLSDVRVENLGTYRQSEVHGLLGQRAIDPKPVQALFEQPTRNTDDGDKLAALATTTISAALNLGGAAACATRLCSAPACTVASYISSAC